MVQELPRHTGAGGPEFVRLLVRLTGADIAAPAQALPSRLSRWLGWADAIALSAALKESASAGRGPAERGPAQHGGTAGSTSADAAAARSAVLTSADDGRDDCARVRAELEQAIAAATGAGGSRSSVSMQRGPQRARNRNASRPEDDAESADYATYRQRYVAVQQAMETHIADLRGRLRTMLASSTADVARLAMVDAAMEQALAGREQSLLLEAPALLEGHFERLRRDALAARTDGEAGPLVAATSPGAWLATFREDMRRILLAELDIRLQPIEGLLSALHACFSRTL